VHKGVQVSCRPFFLRGVLADHSRIQDEKLALKRRKTYNFSSSIADVKPINNRKESLIRYKERDEKP
jgi:hypothetical protein